LHDYESGRSEPGATELVKLFEILEVSPNRLLLGTDNPLGAASESGVLVALARMSVVKPERALGLSLFILPLVATLIGKIGGATLMALASIADETLRARDPEAFQDLAKLVAELEKVDAKALAAMPPEQQQQVIADIQGRVGRSRPTT
jgi:hypothetical protein